MWNIFIILGLFAAICAKQSDENNQMPRGLRIGDMHRTCIHCACPVIATTWGSHARQTGVLPIVYRIPDRRACQAKFTESSLGQMNHSIPQQVRFYRLCTSGRTNYALLVLPPCCRWQEGTKPPRKFIARSERGFQDWQECAACDERDGTKAGRCVVARLVRR